MLQHIILVFDICAVSCAPAWQKICHETSGACCVRRCSVRCSPFINDSVVYIFLEKNEMKTLPYIRSILRVVLVRTNTDSNQVPHWNLFSYFFYAFHGGSRISIISRSFFFFSAPAVYQNYCIHQSVVSKPKSHTRDETWLGW